MYQQMTKVAATNSCKQFRTGSGLTEIHPDMDPNFDTYNFPGLEVINFFQSRPTLKIFLFRLTRPCFTGMGWLV